MATPDLPAGGSSTEGPPPQLPGECNEDLDFEIAFYEGILEHLPDSTDVLMALGNDYTQRGLFEKGLGVDKRLCELRQRDPIIHYNLACSYSLLGRIDESIQALEQAIAFGYVDLRYVQQDPDLENLRRDPRYVALLEGAVSKKLTS
jgi:tetratricopeptide (TPR) repeat protein